MTYAPDQPARARAARQWRVSVFVALLPWLLHGLARELDRVFGLLLHTTLDVPDLVPRGFALLERTALVDSALAWTLAGAGTWLCLALVRGLRGDSEPGAGCPLPQRLRRAAVCTAPVFLPLLVRPALSLLSLVALWTRPAYPYGFTLPVALTQDLGWAQDSATVVALALGVARALELRWPAGLRRIDWRPRLGDVWLGAFLAYASLAPASARLWDTHPGNEPKYLRMGAALALDGGLDIAHIEAPIEDRRARPLAVLVSAAPLGAWQATGRLLDAWRAGRPLGSTRPPDAEVLAHLTVRAATGGAYHVLAPGPAVLLAPWLRADHALNRWRGTPGRIGLTLLAWQALAALLVARLFGFVRRATGRPLQAALVALLVAVLPPLLFYSFQFYPEVPAALVFVCVLERLLFECAWRPRDGLMLGLGIAALPWLHQKYLPLGLALLLWGLLRGVDRLAPGRALLALLAPVIASLAGFALYNFALTGSLRPDALFRVLGREGVGLATLTQGLLGLALDARYGLLPYVPVLVVGLVGLSWPSARARRLRAALPAAAVYYLTVASAENWTGSISNLGRFMLPLVPLLAVGIALVLADLDRRVGAWTILGVLATWSVGLALVLWRDPRAANDCAELLAGSVFVDGHVYLPDLLWRSWSSAPAGLVARVLVAAMLLVLLRVALRQAARRGPGGSPTRALAGLLLALLSACALLERWPGARRAPLFRESLRLSEGVTVVVAGVGHVTAGGELEIEPGRLDLMVRGATPRASLQALVRRPSRDDARRTLPLHVVAELTGRRGNHEVLARHVSTWTEPARLTLALD